MSKQLKGTIEKTPSGKYQITDDNNTKYKAFEISSLSKDLQKMLKQSQGTMRVSFEPWQIVSAGKYLDINILKKKTVEISPQIHDQREPHEITEIRPANNKLQIKFWPKIEKVKNNEPYFEDEQPNEKFQATDPALAFQKGNKFSKAEPHRIIQFGPKVAAFNGDAPNIDANPYNFVTLNGVKPWHYKKDHPCHDRWTMETFSGIIEYQATSLTPVFVPEGFPFASKTETYQNIDRHFCRMKRHTGITKYAIPGSSVKGVIRSAVEALSNSRMGVVNEKYYEKPLPYRRRVYSKKGVIDSDPSTSNPIKVTEVEEIYIEKRWLDGFKAIWGGSDSPSNAFYYTDRIVRKKRIADPATNGKLASPSEVKIYYSNLFNRKNKNHNYSHRIIKKGETSYKISKTVYEAYENNLKHAHYENHHNTYFDHNNTPIDPGQGRNKPYYEGNCSLDKALENLKLRKGDLIYFTIDNGTTNINSFGKNLNYLWPSTKSVKDLAGNFFPPPENSLKKPLSMAERMFGFPGKHKKSHDGSIESHPYRGKVRFESLWCPDDVDINESNWGNVSDSNSGFKLELAPLTSPQTYAKARPLYLMPDSDGKSSSYSDVLPKMRGRKFYWHQHDPDGTDGIWNMHKRSPTHDIVKSQLPPAIMPLKSGTIFKGRIHFDNLAPEELGALIYALQGDGSYDHAIKIGKGKPRGLGSMKIEIQNLMLCDPQIRYKSFSEIGESILSKEKIDEKIESFKLWCENQYNENNNKESKYDDIEFIKDYKKLHTFPENGTTMVKYYPLNFSDYSWLPEDNSNPDKARNGRPKAMELAMDY